MSLEVLAYVVIALLVCFGVAAVLLRSRRPTQRKPPMPEDALRRAGTPGADGEGKVTYDAVATGENRYVIEDDLVLDDGPRRRLPLTTMAAALALLLTIPLGAWLIDRWRTTNDPERFVVLVAPFRSVGGDGGREVANELARELNALPDQAVLARVMDDVPADEAAAAQRLSASQADLLIWGDVEAGSLLDSPSLRPLLFYRPTGTFALTAINGYYGRFAVPGASRLSDQPINGRAVLVPLTEALSAYARGDFDLAEQQLAGLVDTYPELRASLPRSVRADMLWAQRQYGAAIDEYRRALNGAGAEQVAITNNIGAVQLDQGDPQAEATLLQAAGLDATGGLAPLHTNLAIAALRRSDPQAALDALGRLPQAEQQRPLVALLTEAAALRADGQHDAAEAVLQQAQRRIPAETDLSPADFRALTRQHLGDAVNEQQALLAVNRLVPGRGLLAWELSAMQGLDPATLNSHAETMRDIATSSDELLRQWRSTSTAADAAGSRVQGAVAAGQAARIEVERGRQRYLEALLLNEASRMRPDEQGGSLFTAMWRRIFGDNRPASRATELLRSELDNNPNNVDYQYELGRALLLSGDGAAADAAFAQARQLAPNRPEPPFGQAQRALEQAQGDAARNLLREAIAADQGFFPARMQLAGLELAANNLDGALEQQRWLAENRASFANDLALAQTLRQKGASFYFEAETILLRWEPTEKAAQIELGRLYRAADKLDAAEQVLNRAATQEPPSSEASFEYAQLLEARGRLAEAATQYERAIELDGGNTTARVALAHLYARSLGRMDDAVQQYQALVDAEISDPGQLLQAGDVLLSYGDARAAYTAYERAREVNPDDPLIYHKLAQASLARGNLGRARSQEQEALDRSGGALAEAHVGMGEIERREGNLAAAREAFERGRALNPNLPGAYIGLGQVTADEGRWSVALGYFQNAVALDPNSALAHFWLAEAQLRLPEPQLPQAIASYSRTLELQPIFPEAKLGLAQAFDASGNREATWQLLEQALEQRPAYAEALLLRGKLHQQAGNDDQALADYNASINANDNIAETYFRRGLLEVQREEYRAARRDLSQAIELQENFPEARYWLGRSYFIEGDYEAALQEFDQALALRPDFTEAQTYRDQAQQRIDAVRAATS